MSGENLEIVRRAFDAYLRGDEEEMFSLTAPDIVVTQFPDQLDRRDFHGHAGVRRSMAEWIGTWDDWSIEPLSAFAEGELVFFSARQHGRGKTSGAPMVNEVVFVFTVRDGLIARWRMFHTIEEARRAAG